MSQQLESPYPSAWNHALRGNLHAHSTLSDGACSPQEVVDNYASRFYDFLMFSDHDRVGGIEQVEDARSLILLPGVEVSANGPHLLQVGAAEPVAPSAERQRVIDAIAAAGGFAVCNHPNWQARFNHFPQETLEELQGYTGIEIYNGCIRRLEGSPLATDRWDMLLSRGRVVWGHGTDDAHRESDVGVAWDVALVQQRTPAAVLEALREGAFYVSTGVEISEIHVEGDTLHLQAPDAKELVVISEHGREIASRRSNKLTLRVPPEANGYVRVECHGSGNSMAWTQPFPLKKS